MNQDVLSVFTEHPIAWAVLVIALLLLSYGAFSIKNEKINFLKTAIPRNLGPLDFITPSWWTPILENANEIKFKRADTNYDWTAYFHFVRDKKLIMDELLKTLEIEPDEKSDKQEGETGLWKFSRIETTGTRSFEDRVHLDAIIFSNSSGEQFLCYSLSSILNGCVEGPFFDEVIEQMKKGLRFI